MRNATKTGQGTSICASHLVLWSNVLVHRYLDPGIGRYRAPAFADIRGNANRMDDWKVTALYDGRPEANLPTVTSFWPSDKRIAWRYQLQLRLVAVVQNARSGARMMWSFLTGSRTITKQLST